MANNNLSANALAIQVQMMRIDIEVKTRWSYRAGRAGEAIREDWDVTESWRDWEWLDGQPEVAEKVVEMPSVPMYIPPWSCLYTGPERPRKARRARRAERRKANQAKYLARKPAENAIMPAVDMRVEDGNLDEETGFQAEVVGADANGAMGETGDVNNGEVDAEKADADSDSGDGNGAGNGEDGDGAGETGCEGADRSSGNGENVAVDWAEEGPGHDTPDPEEDWLKEELDESINYQPEPTDGYYYYSYYRHGDYRVVGNGRNLEKSSYNWHYMEIPRD